MAAKWWPNSTRTCRSERSPGHRYGGLPASCAWVQLHDPVGDVQAVVAVGDQVGAHGGDDQPQGVDGFASLQADDTEGSCPEDGDGCPGDMTLMEFMRLNFHFDNFKGISVEPASR